MSVLSSNLINFSSFVSKCPRWYQYTFCPTMFTFRFPPETVVDEDGVQLGGQGAYGSVFCIPRIRTALKAAQDNLEEGKLGAEFNIYAMMHHKSTAWRSTIIRCPVPLAFYTTVLSAEENLQITVPALTQDEKGICAAFSMELVNPMNKTMWRHVRASKNRLLGLAHLMLNAKRVKNSNSDIELGEPVRVGYETAEQHLGIDVHAVARELGRLLAHFHFVLRYDMNDVEIVLGAAKDSPDKVGVYVIDFSNVTKFESPRLSAHTLRSSDGYFPKPGSELWPDFITGYLEYAAARRESAAAAQLVQEFDVQPAGQP